MNDKTKVYDKILSMAKEHDVSLDKSEEDLKLLAISRLSDNEIQTNKAMWGIAKMIQKEVLTEKEGHKLLTEFMEEMEIYD